MTAPRVILACAGLDHVHRGFETWARECFEALRDEPGLELELVKGSGPSAARERAVPTLRRETALARRLGERMGREPYVPEHISFAWSLAALAARRRPALVYFTEWHVGAVLARWRAFSRLRFGLLFCNGALAPGPYPRLDHVQQLVPGALEYATARGEPAEKQTVLPLGFRIAPSLEPRGDDESRALRVRLGLPSDRRIVLSVGALNRQKRHDYVVEEIAGMSEPRPYLLLVGQREAETDAIERLAASRLGSDNHGVRTVAPAEMADIYRAADIFVLASLWESFGRVLIEALAAGLPCLSHNYPVMNWVVGEHARSADLTQRGALASMLQALPAAELDEPARQSRHASAYERFSWDRLARDYVALLRRCALSGRDRRTPVEGLRRAAG